MTESLSRFLYFLIDGKPRVNISARQKSTRRCQLLYGTSAPAPFGAGHVRGSSIIDILPLFASGFLSGLIYHGWRISARVITISWCHRWPRGKNRRHGPVKLLLLLRQSYSLEFRERLAAVYAILFAGFAL